MKSNLYFAERCCRHSRIRSRRCKRSHPDHFQTRKSQKPKISFRAEGTILEPTRLPTFMNSVETLNLYNEALNNEGTASIRTDEEIAKYGPGADRDLYPDTDWLGTMLRNHTYNMRYTLNVRGGTERARYFVSGAFYQENGIFKDFGNDYDNNIGLKRYNLRSNIDFDATKTTTVKVDLSGQYLQTNYPGNRNQHYFYYHVPYSVLYHAGCIPTVPSPDIPAHPATAPTRTTCLLIRDMPKSGELLSSRKWR